MKYRILFKLLRFLIQLKRFFWWIGTRIYFVLSQIFGPVWRLGGYLHYKLNFFAKQLGIANASSWFLKRGFLQIALFLLFFSISLPQTRVYAKKEEAVLPGQNTIAYALSGPDEEYGLEEISAEPARQQPETRTLWREGALTNQFYAGGLKVAPLERDLAGLVAGGSAIFKPFIMPGATVGGLRQKVERYEVSPGDSLGSIAENFDVSVATIFWENNLGTRSIIRPGDILRIPPVTGVTHKIKKGDTLKKIAARYEAKPEEIIKFNRLKEDGTDLIVGELIMIPNGIKPQERALANVPRVSQSAISRLAIPPRSSITPSASGFIWPAASRIITQYFTWKHHGVDIAGPWQTANYAAKAGTVVVSQCGWNSGYGCYIIIDHGGGLRTLYGHNSKLLVFPGDYVEAGQTIALMGNTGRVRGATGVHLHFEVQLNGRRVNPFGYVR